MRVPYESQFTMNNKAEITWTIEQVILMMMKDETTELFTFF